MAEDIIERIEALRESLSELQDQVGGIAKRSAVSKRYEDFIRSTTDWVWETDANLNFAFVSEGIAGAFGVPARAMEGRYLFSLTHFREVDDALLGLVDLIEEHRPFRNVALEVTSAGGERHRVMLSGVPAFDEVTGNFIGYRGSGIDLTGRAVGETPAQEFGDRFAEALDAGKVGLWEWTLGSGALYVAPGLTAMLGHAKDSFTDIEAWRRCIHADDRDAVGVALDDHLAGRTPEIDLDHRMIDGEGGTRWLRFRARVVRGADGAALRVGGACTDITGQKEIERELRAATEVADLANQAKTDFLAHLSHELRTPLNAIIGFSEAIKDGYLGPLSPEKSREYASDVHEASRHLLELINDVLDLSRVEAGQLRLAEEALDIAEAVNSSIRLVEGRAASQRLRLEVEIAEDVPELRADPRLFRQVMLNLLTNAVKFTGEGGVITVRARRRDDGGVTLEVADTGIGMAEDEIPKALTPFGQVGDDADRLAEGTGLGLPLSKSLVELHGGWLEISSAKGSGTTVTVGFPASRSIA